MMTGNLFSALLVSLLLVGCAVPKPVFRAAWYLQNEPGAQKSQMIYVAILNQSEQKQLVKNVFVNRVDNQPGSGWKLGAATELRPGELYISPLEKFEAEGANLGKFADRCQLPVGISIETAIEPHGVQAEMTGLMPSSIPEGWASCAPSDMTAGNSFGAR